MNPSLVAGGILRQLALIAFLIGSPTVALAATLRTVALGGQSAPGLPDGISILGFSQYVLNDAGQVAFTSLLAGNNVDATNNRALWFETPDGLTVVARTASRAPGTPEGVSFGNFRGPPGLDNAGRIAFVGDLTGNAVDDGNNQGIWSQRSGGLSLVARAGSSAIGTPAGVSYARGFGLSLNNNGQTTFIAQLIGSGIDSSNDRGIWSDRSGNVALIARTGDPAPGMSEGVVFGELANLLSNYAGVSFSATLTGGGIDFPRFGSIWSYRSGSLALVARRGVPAPGIDGEAEFGNIGPPRLDGAGNVSFVGELSGSRTGIDETNRWGIWSQRSGVLELRLRSGTPAPGTAEGVKFFGFTGFEVNDLADFAFSALLTGTGVSTQNDTGIWAERSGHLTLIAREGSQAPGTPNGVNFGNFILTSPRINNSGQLGFIARLTGPGVNHDSFWATDRHGVLHLIAREGELLEVAPGEFRTISNLGAASPEFNNLGQVAFHAAFSDGSSGIFVSNLVAILEPGSIALVSLVAPAVLVLIGRNRCREVPLAPPVPCAFNVDRAFRLVNRE
jgi:hypothetical protein